MAGLVTEAYHDEFIGKHAWRVPIFLFREHDDVEKYLWALRFDPERVREIYGRHGTDFVGIALNGGGEVVRVIAGEAKWRKTLTESAVAALLHGKRPALPAWIIAEPIPSNCSCSTAVSPPAMARCRSGCAA